MHKIKLNSILKVFLFPLKINIEHMRFCKLVNMWFQINWTKNQFIFIDKKIMYKHLVFESYSTPKERMEVNTYDFLLKQYIFTN